MASPEDFVDGIVIAVNPIAFSLGPASIRWFGVAVALGIVAGIMVAVRVGSTRGIAESDVNAFALAGCLAGLLGARLFHVADKMNYYLQNPYFLFTPSQVSMSSWGALLAGMAAVAIVARRRRVSAAGALDAGVPAFIVGQFVGRLGSLINGESWGSPTDLPWAVTYLNAEAMLPPGRLGMPTHPYPVYEMIWTAAALLAAWLVWSRVGRSGALAATSLLFYAVGRLALAQFREEGAWLWGFQQSQVLSAIVILVCLPVVVHLVTSPKRRPGSQEAPEVAGKPVL